MVPLFIIKLSFQLTFERKFRSHCCSSSNGACGAESILGRLQDCQSFFADYGFIIWSSSTIILIYIWLPYEALIHTYWRKGSDSSLEIGAYSELKQWNFHKCDHALRNLFFFGQSPCVQLRVPQPWRAMNNKLRLQVCQHCGYTRCRQNLIAILMTQLKRLKGGGNKDAQAWIFSTDGNSEQMSLQSVAVDGWSHQWLASRSLLLDQTRYP